MFTVEYYELPNGVKPVEQFIDSLEQKMQSKALASIVMLKTYGNTIREPYSKPVGNGIFELRIKFASDITRIFYFFHAGNKIVVTNGFVKKTQKTPPKEIALAIKYKTDYERRDKNG